MPWKRITLVSFVLIGGTISFGYWFLNQHNQVLDDLSASYLANINSAPYFKQRTELASTSPEISGEFATSTDGAIPSITATTTAATTTLLAATSTDLKLAFTFPKKNDEVFIGCTYRLSWQTSTIIKSLEPTLVDAGTKESMGPIASGLAKENVIKKDSQNLSWKVGAVWPGKYYIKVSNINGIDVETRSNVFTISKIPNDISAAEREKKCKQSDSQ